MKDFSDKPIMSETTIIGAILSEYDGDTGAVASTQEHSEIREDIEALLEALKSVPAEKIPNDIEQQILRTPRKKAVAQYQFFFPVQKLVQSPFVLTVLLILFIVLTCLFWFCFLVP